jgi:sigma-B regulation protein RsbU (phosphoserine phosphatase)
LRYQVDRGDFGPGDKDDLIEQVVATNQSGEAVSYEREIAGTGRTLQVYLAPTPEGGYVTIVTDITERKRAEETLRESEEQVHLLLDSTAEAIYGIDMDGECTFCNPVCVAMLGYDGAEDLLGRHMHGLIHHTRLDGAPYPVEECLIYQAIYKDEGTHVDDEVLWRKDGTSFAAEYWSYPIKRDDRVIGAVVTFLDITERKQAEAALQEAYGIIRDQRDRMEDELNIGREIQMSMIPLVFPPFPDHGEFSVFAALEPAREVGGDFYDYYFIDEERFCFCIGDVSGKGVPAALFMAVTKTLIKSRAIDDFSTASILTHVNAELSADNETSMFVTIFLGILNIRSGEFVYTNAGHNPPYLRRKGGSLQRLDVRHGPLIGAVPGMVYREDTDTLTPGDMLFMYTDGVTEERNADRELFSEKRLVSVLASTTVDSVENAVRDTVAAVKDFRGDGNQEDDITALAVRFQGSSVHDPVAVFHIMARNDLREIARVNQEFQKFAEEHGVPVEVGRRISVLFDDLLNNVISYAFPDDEAHEIEIRTEIATNRLTVTISDDGIPFNPLFANSPDTSLPLDKRALGGLGIHLIRNLVDDMSYQRRIDRNVLTLVKHIE